MHQTDLKIEENEAGSKNLITKTDIPADSLILTFHYNRLIKNPDRYTIQWEENKHLDPEPEILRYTNHSCDPNVFFDFSSMKLVSLKEIKAGEPLLFFYPSTEWEMEEAFNCNCGSDICLTEIKGAKHIDKKVLEQYRLSPYIKSKL